jgi:hypothetical protein
VILLARAGAGKVSFSDDHYFLMGQAIGKVGYDLQYHFLGTVKHQQRDPPLPTSVYATISSSMGISTGKWILMPTETSMGTSTPTMHGLAASCSTNFKLWHQRLRHLNMQSVKIMLKTYAQHGDTGKVDMADVQPRTESQEG